eukprot:CAMPEP_0204177146 /NCGR_PEP_ID=MMETSP0361-20130328/48218_1 /ASSEMBLY_ACC=CAM_ASM_000343 /TAXON_ID=268821 /ORGANISM="Scrippsiella Hangoei, Strain SHTV-5" /LENGTH=132 /DNA_ID=CAMNT_0051136069 /DNA_START=11 /DNA_END=409 /DNA_ORIENTATION=-
MPTTGGQEPSPSRSARWSKPPCGSIAILADHLVGLANRKGGGQVPGNCGPPVKNCTAIAKPTASPRGGTSNTANVHGCAPAGWSVLANILARSSEWYNANRRQMMCTFSRPEKALDNKPACSGFAVTNTSSA